VRRVANCYIRVTLLLLVLTSHTFAVAQTVARPAPLFRRYGESITTGDLLIGVQRRSITGLRGWHGPRPASVLPGHQLDRPPEKLPNIIARRRRRAELLFTFVDAGPGESPGNIGERDERAPDVTART